MKLTKIQIERLVRKIIESLKEQDQIQFKVAEGTVLKRGVELIQGEYDKERKIEIEANNMIDDLERKGQEFDRHKMFIMIKKKLAKDKGVVL